jgi:kynurenine formamidase
MLSIGVLIVVVIGIRPSHAQAELSILQTGRLVNLTQPLNTQIPLFPGDPPVEITQWASYAKDGYFINRISIGEHSGTHWGTPNTFIEGATSADRFPFEKLVAPAIVFDIREQARQNSDYQLTLADVRAWERSYGRIPKGSTAILFTGWQSKWSDPVAFINQDAQGVLHWPGFSTEAVQFMVSQRQIGGLGTDTHGADPGNDTTYGPSNTMYTANGMILECLGGLDQLPPVGAVIVVGGLPIQGGSGSPARVLGFVPARRS